MPFIHNAGVGFDDKLYGIDEGLVVVNVAITAAIIAPGDALSYLFG
jgi:hypothetical protein